MLAAGGCHTRRGHIVRGGRIALLLIAAAVFSTGCATDVDGSGTAAPGEVSAYSADLSASRAAQTHRDGVDTCRQAMDSMVVMVRGYNAFVRRLSATGGYGGVGDLDDKARASLIAGSDQLRALLADGPPADLTESLRAFLATTERLGESIRRRETTPLNAVAARWTRDKSAVLGACARYLPPPPAPAQQSGARESAAPTSVRPTG